MSEIDSRRWAFVLPVSEVTSQMYAPTDTDRESVRALVREHATDGADEALLLDALGLS